MIRGEVDLFFDGRDDGKRDCGLAELAEYFSG